ncbi:MAG: class I SAM-dependent methyltransferase [Alphaproteobacteria bacterium]|nr:class I SAM-dependent methyltransferase [Alphaproteobacteria bacterium]
MASGHMLSHDQAKRYYDVLGAGLDRQGFFEGPPLRDLARHLDLEACKAVGEFGSGTGRFAEELLTSLLPQGATYVGVDVSSVMVALAQKRLARFADRAEILQSDGTIRIDRPDSALDCLVSSFVMDLLSDTDIRLFLEEAHRLLRPGGQIGLVSLTKGSTAASRAVTVMWSLLHRISPWIVGGCRPIEISPFLKARQWQLEYRNIVTPYALASEIVVARRL